MTSDDASARLDAALLAGGIMLQAGGEASRVEETVTRVAEGLGLEQPEVFVMPTGIFLGARWRGRPLAALRRVHRRQVNLDQVSRVNELSRALTTRGTAYDPRVLLRRLETIAARRERYPRWLLTVSGAAAAAASTLVIGGGPLDFLPSLAANLVAQGIARLVLRGLPRAFNLGLAGLVAALLASVWHRWVPGVSPAAIVAGALMSLVPGLAFTAAVQDALAGDLVSSGARALEAVMLAGALAAGVGAGLWLWPAAAESTLSGHLPGGLLLVLAFASSVASAVVFHSPPDALPWAGAAGAAGWAVGWLAATASHRTVLSPFLGAAALAAVSVFLSRWRKQPTLLYTAPALVPLVPGFRLYQGLLALAEGQLDRALAQLSQAALVGIGLGAGVAVVIGVFLHQGRRSA